MWVFYLIFSLIIRRNAMREIKWLFLIFITTTLFLVGCASSSTLYPTSNNNVVSLSSHKHSTSKTKESVKTNTDVSSGENWSKINSKTTYHSEKKSVKHSNKFGVSLSGLSYQNLSALFGLVKKS